ncbi:MAG: DUF1629 domain-containing protein [Pseudomonadota bacterium]
MNEPETQVWLSDCYTNSKHIAFYDCEEPEDFKGFVDGLRDGKPLTPEQLPTKIWPADMRNAERGQRVKRIRDFACIQGGVMVVSPMVAALFREFDLGFADDEGSGARRVRLHPIEQLTAEDGRLVGQLFLFHVATEKDSLILRPSNGVTLKETKKGLRARIRPVGQVSLNLSPESLIGPDIWREKRLSGPILFSNRLVRAMHDAKIREISFQPCVIADAPNGTNA